MRAQLEFLDGRGVPVRDWMLAHSIRAAFLNPLAPANRNTLQTYDCWVEIH